MKMIELMEVNMLSTLSQTDHGTPLETNNHPCGRLRPAVTSKPGRTGYPSHSIGYMNMLILLGDLQNRPSFDLRVLETRQYVQDIN